MAGIFPVLTLTKIKSESVRGSERHLLVQNVDIYLKGCLLKTKSTKKLVRANYAQKYKFHIMRRKVSEWQQVGTNIFPSITSWLNLTSLWNALPPYSDYANSPSKCPHEGHRSIPMRVRKDMTVGEWAWHMEEREFPCLPWSFKEITLLQPLLSHTCFTL